MTLLILFGIGVVLLLVAGGLVAALVGALLAAVAAMAPLLIVGAIGFVVVRALTHGGIGHHGLGRQNVRMPAIDLRRRGPGAIAEPVEQGIFCPSCERPVSRNWATCPHCGYRKYVAPDLVQRRCATCGTELQKDWNACPYCSSAVQMPLLAAAPGPRTGPVTPTTRAPETENVRATSDASADAAPAGAASDRATNGVYVRVETAVS